MKRIILLFAISALTLFGASPTLFNRTGQSVISNGNAAFGGPYEVNWQAMPTSTTVVTLGGLSGGAGTALASHVLGYCVYNSTGSAIVITINTGDASPLPLPLSGSLAANTSACFTFGLGLRVNGGFTVSAASSGVYYGTVFTN